MGSFRLPYPRHTYNFYCYSTCGGPPTLIRLRTNNNQPHPYLDGIINCGLCNYKHTVQGQTIKRLFVKTEYKPQSVFAFICYADFGSRHWNFLIKSLRKSFEYGRGLFLIIPSMYSLIGISVELSTISASYILDLFSVEYMTLYPSWVISENTSVYFGEFVAFLAAHVDCLHQAFYHSYRLQWYHMSLLMQVYIMNQRLIKHL